MGATMRWTAGPSGFGSSDNQGQSGVLANCGYHEPIVIV